MLSVIVDSQDLLQQRQAGLKSAFGAFVIGPDHRRCTACLAADLRKQASAQTMVKVTERTAQHGENFHKAVGVLGDQPAVDQLKEALVYEQDVGCFIEKTLQPVAR